MADSRTAQGTSATELTVFSSVSREVWQVDGLMIDVPARTVLREGVPLRVTGLSFNLLVALVRASPNAVEQDALIETVWAGRVVSPETVTKRVKLLRDALGDDPSDPRYVGLVWGHGYKLLVTARQLQTSSEHSSATRRRTPVAWGIGIAALILVAALLFWVPQQPSPSTDSIARPGIAVLPFSAQGAEPQEAEFLAAGMHDDIITALAQIQDLLVISRTSVLAFRDQQLPVTEISKTLNVDKVLEGHLQRTPDRIKLNVQLIDAKNDRHLWAKTYQHHLSVANVLAVQRQIAADVAAELKLSLAAETFDHTAPPTQNLHAYDHYLVARQALELRSAPLNPASTRRAMAAAEKALHAAIAEDSEFAEAYALLSFVYSWRVITGLETTQAARDQVTASLLKAVALAPNNPWVHLASGSYHFMIGNYDESLREQERAAKGLPQETDMLLRLGQSYLVSGRLDDARVVLERAVVQDPLHFGALGALSATRHLSADLTGALELNRRARVLQPENVSLAYQEASLRYQMSGDLAAYRQAITELPVVDTQSVLAHWNVAFRNRDYAGALAALRARPFKVNTSIGEFTPYQYYTGLTHLLAGNKGDAIAALRVARTALESALGRDASDPRVLSRLAEVLAALGERESAREAVQKTLDSAMFKKTKVMAWGWNFNLVHALTLNGDIDEALRLFESDYDVIGWTFAKVCAHDPILEPLRARPRYSELVQRFATPSESS